MAAAVFSPRAKPQDTKTLLDQTPPGPKTPEASKIVQSPASASAGRECTSSGCIQRDPSSGSRKHEGLDSKWSDTRLVGQLNGGNQDGSPVSRSVDLSVAVLGGLPSVPVAERPTECARRRGRIRTAIAFLDKVLEESSEALKLKPSKNDRLTAQNYHACFRHLHWSLGRCQQMQELAEMLENYDSGRFLGPSVSSDYAQLSVDIYTRHDRALLLLIALCQNDEEEDRKEVVEKVSNPFNDAFQSWVNSLTTQCGSRTCLRDASCTGYQNSRKSVTSSAPD